ncbi:rhoptry-associated protein 1 alpha1 [Plakobranchus ocellatus]|uniref:Rhoptry-associated protein 1 alpha1 n=1 Tax=Plakobranchus ocellatus TaxID=259542 RepID=A0AAV4DPG4_9GAST|nr:rhoptry-associated protein 1 alpha1 [Plakobranchus ocellatus]
MEPLDCLDTDVYVCTGQNKHGVTTNEISVGVQCSQQLASNISQPDTVEVAMGETAELDVEIYGYPTPQLLTLMRTKDSKHLTGSARHLIEYLPHQAPFGCVKGQLCLDNNPGANLKTYPENHAVASLKAYLEKKAYASLKAYLNNNADANLKAYLENHAVASLKAYLENKAYASLKAYLNNNADANLKAYLENHAVAGLKAYLENKSGASLKAYL